MTTTLKREYRREPAHPLPTAPEIEDALDALLTAIALQRPAKFSLEKLSPMHWDGEVTEELPGED